MPLQALYNVMRTENNITPLDVFHQYDQTALCETLIEPEKLPEGLISKRQQKLGAIRSIRIAPLREG